MSLKNKYVLEQIEKGWPNKNGRVRKKRKVKKMWSKLRRKLKDSNLGFDGYEF